MILGMDFGTTNSGMAVYDGRVLRPIPLGPAGSNRVVDRTALYITHDQSIYTGQQAVDRYLEQNVGRPVRMERVRVGTISVTAAEIGTYYRDVHIERDMLSPGRLFTSFKTFLSSARDEGTVVGNLSYELEDIVSTYLRVAKLRAERFLEREVPAIVLGRPVAFSRDPAADALARDRLVGAAFRAGYDTVYLQYEPVAAAFHYETSLQHERTVLVFDFGGGTLDVTVMRMGNPRTRRVLAAGGIPVAGDVFDQRIVRMKLARLFGEGSSYGAAARRVPVPAWIYDSLSDWQSIITLQQPENRSTLEHILASSDRPEGIRNLIELASRNYGLKLYRAVEQAKTVLSDQTEATIAFDGSAFSIRQAITRREFEALIRDEIQAVAELLDRVLRDAGLSARDVDAVVHTGGSSRIPVFVQLLNRTFGADRVRAIDIFSSVTSGLAVAAHRIEAGELAAEPCRPAGRDVPAATIASAHVPAVDPAFLKAWVAAQERAAVTPNPSVAVTWLTADNRLVATELPCFPAGGTDPIAFQAAHPGAIVPNQAVLAGLDDQLVLLTSSYRFLLTTPRQLLVLDQSGVSLPRMHGFEHHEIICTLGSWTVLREQRHLAVVAGRGFVRVVDMERVRGRLDRSIPFSLDVPKNESSPVALVGVRRDRQLALVTSAARALRVDLDAVSSLGLQAIKRERDESIVGCVMVQDSDEILLVAGDGAARRVPAALVPVAAEPNTRGKSVAPRWAVRSAARYDPASRPWLLTARRLHPVAQDGPSDAAPSRKPVYLAALEGDEQVAAVVSGPPR